MVNKQAPSTIIVDIANCIAGRTCSRISKLLLEGNKVSVINAEKAMISGNRYKSIEIYKEDLEIGSVTNPIHGPFHPRRPDTILTRMVRGMIPKRKTSGIEAFRQLRVYIGVPEKLKREHPKVFDECRIRKPESYYISVGDIAKQIGWKGEYNT